jgi:membrane associated rhomboid family serine protease
MTDIDTPPRQPALNIPPMTTALLALNIGVDLLRQLLPKAVDNQLLATFSFAPARYLQEPAALGLAAWPAWVAPISYQFLHVGWGHLGGDMLFLLAFGSGAEQRLGSIRLLFFYLACGVLAAFAQLAVAGAEIPLLVGASGATSGLFGAILWYRARSWQQLGSVVAIGLAAIVIGNGLVPLGDDTVRIAWVVNIGGFLAGLMLLPLLAPKGIGSAEPQR